MLEESAKVALQAEKIGEEFLNQKEKNRNILLSHNIIHTVADGTFDGLVSAVDGSLVLDKKSLGDLSAAAAVSAPYSKSELPSELAQTCNVQIDIIPRSVFSNHVLGALMSLMELKLITDDTVSDLVMVDGSYISTLMNISNGLQYLDRLPGGDENPLVHSVKTLLNDSDLNARVLKFLTDPRIIALPKYSTSNELQNIGIHLLGKNFDTKTQLGYILEHGETTIPLRISNITTSQKTLFSRVFKFDNLSDEILSAFDALHCVYFKPHPFSPAIRIDFTGERSIAELKQAYNCVAMTMQQPDIYEPLPLFLADRWAKNISHGAGAAIAATASSNITDPKLKVLMSMSYRT